MTRSNEPKEVRPLSALTKLARDSVTRPTSADLDRGLTLLFARATARKARAVKLIRWSLAGVLAAVCTLLGFHVASVMRGREREQPAVAYRVEGGSVLAGGYLRDSGDDGVRLIFSEGTRVELMPGARGRLRSVDQEGTRVVLDQGSASFDVARSHQRRWLVDAGPFSVAVKGTLFTVSWDPPTERFELTLRHGSVVVSGPIVNGDIELRAGQRLVVSLPRAETLITEEPPNAPAVAPNTPPSLTGPDPEPENQPSRAGSATASDPAQSPPSATARRIEANQVERKPSWAQHLALGHWDQILEDAARSGIDRTLETASSEDLFALADAARYRRRTDLASKALLAQRRRFAGSARSLDALFLLGRVDESRDRARALGWYEDYLQRAPRGTYAAEAWGRKMVLTHELEGRAAARPIAEEYLRRFPKGSYAGAARALCGEP